MSVLFLLIAASLSIAFFFLIAFLWATKKGQFEDLETPPIRILFDDDKPN